MAATESKITLYTTICIVHMGGCVCGGGRGLSACPHTDTNDVAVCGHVQTECFIENFVYFGYRALA